MIQSVRESIVYHCEGEGEGVKGDRIGWNAMEGDPICSIYSSLAQRARQGPAVLGYRFREGRKAHFTKLDALSCVSSFASIPLVLQIMQESTRRGEREMCVKAHKAISRTAFDAFSTILNSLFEGG